MTEHNKWILDEYVAEYEGEPDYIAEGLALEFTEQALGIMKAKGISQSDLAEKMGVSRSHVSKIFNAPSNLTLRSIARIAIALGATPYLGIKPNKTKDKEVRLVG